MDNRWDTGMVSLFIFGIFAMGLFTGGCIKEQSVRHGHHKAAVSRGYGEWVIDDDGFTKFQWKEPAKNE